MRSRQHISEIFASFIKFVNDSQSVWQNAPKLEKNMEKYLNNVHKGTTSVHYWTLFWHKKWQQDSTNRLAREHLLAYLQEPCYWVVVRTMGSFTSVQYKLSDCFQMAIADADKILQGFSPNKGSKLNSYATVIFKSILTNTLRQKREIDICSDWGLLRQLSQKRLQAGLANAGVSKDKIEQYRLAWTCFNTIYVPRQNQGTQKLPPPDQETWMAIATLYNQESSSPQTPKTIEKWLKQCAQSARNYLYPKTKSLNITPNGQESGELLDNLPDSDGMLLEQIIAKEEAQIKQQQIQQLKEVLAKAINELDPKLRLIIELYYQEGLNQTEVAKKMDIQQFQVSRDLGKAKRLLSHSVIEWGQKNFSLSIDKSDKSTIKEMNAIVHEYLVQSIKSQEI